ncbi:hypothetical protein LCGC14_2171350 [marine sediment metagenome]|uniref:Uncharacterized protein n=1 Tax=marine sediment metagenome TaxID=412755 RepID=A0A0F9G2Q8_9ZZZZ
MPIPPMEFSGSSSATSGATLGGDTTRDRIFRFGSKTVGGDPRFELATAVVIGLAAIAALFIWLKR